MESRQDAESLVDLNFNSCLLRSRGAEVGATMCTNPFRLKQDLILGDKVEDTNQIQSLLSNSRRALPAGLALPRGIARLFYYSSILIYEVKIDLVPPIPRTAIIILTGLGVSQVLPAHIHLQKSVCIDVC